MKKSKTKKDIFFVVCILLIVLILYIFMYFQNKNSTPINEVEIFVNGILYSRLPIVEGKIFEIVNGKQKNTIIFTKNGVKMLHANCKNQLCICQGEVNFTNYKNRYLGQNIICLPNRVIIRLVLKEMFNVNNDIY